jgi:hypothetical protein
MEAFSQSDFPLAPKVSATAIPNFLGSESHPTKVLFGKDKLPEQVSPVQSHQQQRSFFRTRKGLLPRKETLYRKHNPNEMHKELFYNSSYAFHARNGLT